MTLYDELGVRRLINASTTFTVMGGSLMPPEVLDAMRAAAGSFIDMHEFHEKAGAELARLTRNEAAYATSGCAAAIVLAILGCRTGGELMKIAALPDGDSLPNEVVMHAAHRMPYDPALQLAGARIRQVGNVLQTFDWELEAAINERTAAVFWVAGSHMAPGALPLPDVVRIAHARGVPVIVDAAAQLPPVSNLWHFTVSQGADLALFSGGKALRGPQASGLMVGRADLVAAARANGAPNQRLARALKAGKEEIAGLVAAVRRYVSLDHGELADQWYATCRRWAESLAELPGLSVAVDDRNEAGQPVPRVRVQVDEGVVGRSGATIVAGLRERDPGVVVLPDGADAFYIGADLLQCGEEEIVLERVRSEVTPIRR
ncbi:MAG TPA: aminotransferase class V-fold PLP-dependent enzyme [Jatrophihabitans sp.]|nr:aminotransferase class V-fold PLP-dependent enzyme [Jatrophihabitans sp.]